MSFSCLIFLYLPGCVGGGYTDVPWSRPNGKGKYVPSDKSFLFSLFNAGRPPTKFEITKKLFAVSHHPECGPVFGAGADLFICHACDQVADSYSNLPHSYDGQVNNLTLVLIEGWGVDSIQLFKELFSQPKLDIFTGV